MELNENNKIIITDEDGKEITLHILFTYHNEERNMDYVFIYDIEDEENVYPMRYYEEDHTLEEIEDEEEYDEVEEVFNAYMEDPKIQELKNN